MSELSSFADAVGHKKVIMVNRCWNSPLISTVEIKPGKCGWSA